jgi:predicted  nucleic acid-binding Zn-ribbon protein
LTTASEANIDIQNDRTPPKGQPAQTVTVGATLSTLEPTLPHVHPEDVLRMSARHYYVETTPSGQKQFVALKRSRSHQDHHHLRRHHGHGHDHGSGHHHHHDDCAHVTREEWADLVERERSLRETNDALARENQSLKTNLRNGDAELRRLQGWIPHLEHQIQGLRADNQSLRRSLDTASEHSAAHLQEAEKLRKKVHKLERENDTLIARIRDLTRQCQDALSDRVVELKEAVAAWRRKFDEAEGRVIRLRRENADQAAVIADQSERLTVYERILRRNGLLY